MDQITQVKFTPHRAESMWNFFFFFLEDTEPSINTWILKRIGKFYDW